MSGGVRRRRLRLFQIDLLDRPSISAAARGCSGVFHLASPCIVDQVHDPEKELLDPAIKGTLNVLMAAKEAGVRRVVGTSSISAITPSPSWPADVVKREDCWTDVEYCKQKGLWYPLSKTLAEKAAWDFAKEKGLDVVVVNPGTVMGDVISPRLNGTGKLRGIKKLLSPELWNQDQEFWIDEAKAVGKKLAVCSAATKSSVILCLESLIGNERFQGLDCFLAGDDAKEKKPDPSIYLTAAKRLGISVSDCLVVEDSVIGLQLGKAVAYFVALQTMKLED